MSTVAAELQPVRLGQHFEITAQGLTIKGQPSFDDCESLWETLMTTERTIQFAIGDAMRFIRERWGEKASQIISDRTGWTYSTLRVYEHIAEKVPQQVRRLDKLSFSHHISVAKCPPREQQRWLNKAADDEQPWTTRRLAAAVKAGVDHEPTAWLLVATCTSQDQRDQLVRELEARGIHCTTSERRSPVASAA